MFGTHHAGLIWAPMVLHAQPARQRPLRRRQRPHQPAHPRLALQQGVVQRIHILQRLALPYYQIRPPQLLQSAVLLAQVPMPTFTRGISVHLLHANWVVCRAQPANHGLTSPSASSQTKNSLQPTKAPSGYQARAAANSGSTTNASTARVVCLVQAAQLQLQLGHPQPLHRQRRAQRNSWSIPHSKR